MSLSKLSRVSGVAGSGAAAGGAVAGGAVAGGAVAGGADAGGAGTGAAGGGAVTGSLTALAKSVNKVNMSLSESFSSAFPVPAAGSKGGTGSFPRIIARSLSIPSK